jgi:hypothetical protein
MAGRTVAGNVVAACYDCNHARGGELNQTKRGSKFTIGDDTFALFVALFLRLEKGRPVHHWDVLKKVWRSPHLFIRLSYERNTLLSNGLL